MNIIETGLPGLLIMEPRVFADARGYFFESYSEREFNAALAERGMEPVHFVQDNESASVRGVIRGLHFQRPPHTQAKLVRCVLGEVLDVAVDLRKDSPTFGRHYGAVLSAENHRQLFIPRGFAHGFSVLSERAVFQYKCDNYYAPEADGGILLSDPALGIDWRIDLSTAILSDKDTRHPLLSPLTTPF